MKKPLPSLSKSIFSFIFTQVLYKIFGGSAFFIFHPMLLLRLFGGIGLLILLGSCAQMSDAKRFISEGEKTTALVVGFKKQKVISGDSVVYYDYPNVKFITKDNQEVITTLNKSKDYLNVTEGQKVEIYYLPHNPQRNCLVSDVWGNSFFMLLVGIVIIATGFGIDITNLYSQLTISYLIKKGTKIPTRYVKVEKYHADKSCYWQIVCQVYLGKDNKKYLFYSKSLGYDPQPFLDRDIIDVYVLPKNLKKYYMDITFVEEERKAALIG